MLLAAAIDGALSLMMGLAALAGTALGVGGTIWQRHVKKVTVEIGETISIVKLRKDVDELVEFKELLEHERTLERGAAQERERQERERERERRETSESGISESGTSGIRRATAPHPRGKL